MSINHQLKFIITLSLLSHGANAHDPVFSIGPHVLFKNGFELSTEFHGTKNDQQENEMALELSYGVTGDWSIGADLPYVKSENDQGVGDLNLFSKYRFWRSDSLGLQQSAAVLVKINLNNGEKDVSTNSTDGLIGLTYGYEGIKWYRWTSVRYRYNGESSGGIKRGNKTFIDIAGGYRPSPPIYRKPDTVWYLELNMEYNQKATISGNSIADTGGTKLFISPGIFWTIRNFAIKGGVQMPLYQSLNGLQTNDKYRFKIALEWHL